MSTGFLRSRTSHGHLLVLVRLKVAVRGFFSWVMTSEGVLDFSLLHAPVTVTAHASTLP